MNDFLEEVFEVLDITSTDREALRKSFGELLANNFILAFYHEVPIEKQENFKTLVNERGEDKTAVEEWLKNNLPNISQESLTRIDEVIEKAINDFMAILVKGISEEKRQELLKFTEKFN